MLAAMPINPKMIDTTSSAAPKISTYMVLWVMKLTQEGLKPLKNERAMMRVTAEMRMEPKARPPNMPELGS